MPPSRAQRLLGLLSDDILALPKAPSPPPDPDPHLANREAQAVAESPGSLEPNPSADTTAAAEPASTVDQNISALADALSLQDRPSSPSASESSHEPDPYDSSPAADLFRGDLAPWGEAYVSVLVASKFPYKFLNRSYSDPIAKKFFDRNQFWTRDWDLYYVWPPADVASKPLILITLTQFQLLIHEINQYKRHLDFKLTDHHRDCGLILDIPHPAFTPRFLGSSSSRDDFNDMEQRRVPPAAYKAPNEAALPPPDKPTLEAFKAMIEEAVQLNKAKGKAAKAKRKEQRISLQQNWGRLLKRTERYLGLRPDRCDDYKPLEDPTLNWSELQAAQAARTIPPLDSTKPAPFSFNKNVIFISVDIEAFELDSNKITEVGVATLDVLDIVDLPPGNNAENWFQKIRARHFRIDEHTHLNNYRHVAGCADGFEFGKSEFVRLADAPSVVASCFKPPFSADLTPAEAERLWSADDPVDLLGDPSIFNADGKRNLVFVGHDPNQDIKFLQKLGYNPLNLSNLIEVIDTKLLHQHWKRDPQGTSLGRILADLDIIGWKLHNGGNDAVYTLQALLALGVNDATFRGTKQAELQRKQDHDKRMADAIADTVSRISDEADGWSSHGEGDDGGPPSLASVQPLAVPPAVVAATPMAAADESDCIFVGNLPYRAIPRDVEDFFSKFGTVTDVHLPINQVTNGTKGVAYISFASHADARNALERSKGVEFWGRTIRAHVSQPREKKGGRAGISASSSSAGGANPRTNKTRRRAGGGGSSNASDSGRAASSGRQRSSRSATPVAHPLAAVSNNDSSDRALPQGTYLNDGDLAAAGALTGPSKQHLKPEIPDDWW